MNASKSTRRVVAVALWLGLASSTLVSAQGVASSPMMDYGVGQFATVEQWNGTAAKVADDLYVMDYGVGRYATVAGWMGVDKTATAAVSSAGRMIAKR